MGSRIEQALIVVRTYPTPAKKGAEVSCTAAITKAGDWLRLFPVPYRRLPEDKKFSKYQWIEVEISKAPGDPRPESHRINEASIKVLGPVLPTDHAWSQRASIVMPLMAESLCAIQSTQANYGFPTLGVFRPKIKRLLIEPTDAEWSQDQVEALSQGDLFNSEPPETLQKIPFNFRYEFTCRTGDCNGHSMICTDWEMGQAYRKWSQDYGADWEGAFRNKFEAEMKDRFETYFYVGTMHQHPKSWIIVGLYYPPVLNLPLFPDT